MHHHLRVHIGRLDTGSLWEARFRTGTRFVVILVGMMADEKLGLYKTSVETATPRPSILSNRNTIAVVEAITVVAVVTDLFIRAFNVPFWSAQPQVEVIVSHGGDWVHPSEVSQCK